MIVHHVIEKSVNIRDISQRCSATVRRIGVLDTAWKNIVHLSFIIYSSGARQPFFDVDHFLGVIGSDETLAFIKY